MKKRVLKLLVIGINIFLLLSFTGCDLLDDLLSDDDSGNVDSGGSTGYTMVDKWIESHAFTDQEKNYYGCDLTIFPPDAREWIMNTQFTKERMESPYMVNSKLDAWWSSDGYKIQFKASYTTAQGYQGAGTLKTWGESAWYGFDSSDLEIYGEWVKYHTFKFGWDLVLDNIERLKTDSVFAQIIEFAMKLCDELEYDWANYPVYKGPVKPTPGKKPVVCDGYTNEVTERILELDCVQSVQRWLGSNHAWNVLKLADGRTLFFDLTWFDNEHIDEETGVIYQTDEYGWANITFNEELFKYSNVAYGTGDFSHASGAFHSEKTRQ